MSRLKRSFIKTQWIGICVNNKRVVIFEVTVVYEPVTDSADEYMSYISGL